MNKGNMYFNPRLLTLHWLHLNKSLLWFKAEASVSQSVLWFWQYPLSTAESLQTPAAFEEHK